MENPRNRSKTALVIIRIMLAVLIGAHGWHRLYEGSVLEFAEDMSHVLPMGYVLVLMLEFFETIGGLLFAFGRFVFPLSLIYTVMYSAAIVFFHSRYGWFQAGGDDNGAEYAVALIISFLCVGLQAAPARMFAPITFFRRPHAAI